MVVSVEPNCFKQTGQEPVSYSTDEDAVQVDCHHHDRETSSQSLLEFVDDHVYAPLVYAQKNSIVGEGIVPQQKILRPLQCGPTSRRASRAPLRALTTSWI